MKMRAKHNCGPCYLSEPTPATAAEGGHTMLQYEYIHTSRNGETCQMIQHVKLCIKYMLVTITHICLQLYKNSNEFFHVSHTVVSTQPLLYIEDSCRQGVHVPMYVP